MAKEEKCPNCGRCPTCGNVPSGYIRVYPGTTWPWPYIPQYPGPYWYGNISVTNQTAAALPNVTYTVGDTTSGIN